MSRVWHRLRWFWTEPIRAERMALFRIAIGTIVALDTLLTVLPYAAEYLGPQGLNPTELYAFHLSSDWWWSLIPADATNAEVHQFVLGLVAAATCVALGVLTRPASIAMWALLVSVHHRSPYILNGGDFVLQVASLYLVLMPAGAAWSVDAFVRGRLGYPSNRWVRPWALRLAQIQLAVLYLFTGLAKLPTPSSPNVGRWVSGHALTDALATPTLARFEIFASVPWWVLAPFSWITLLWEIMFPLLVIFPATRLPTLAYGVLMHLGIYATLAVNSFSFATLAYYLLFLPVSRLGLEGRPPKE